MGLLILFFVTVNAQTGIKWEETFPDSVLPAGWQVLDKDGSGQGLELFQSVTPQGGTTVYPQADLYLWSSNYQNANMSGLIDEWIISPKISVIYAGDSLYFWAGALDGPFDDSLRVFVSTTDTQLTSFTHMIGYFKVDGPVGSWHKYGFDLSPFDSMDIHFAINYYIRDGGPGGQYSDFVWIDHCIITGDSSTINQPPIEFDLLEPTNFSLLHPVADSTIYFKWSSSTNADNDTLRYRLEILDIFPTLVFNNILDTTFAFDWFGFLNHYSAYRWTVSVTDGKSTVCSPDTFLFFTPPIENLAPFPFLLVSPENGDTLFLSDTINFYWHEAIDPNSDTLLYDLNISGFNLDTTFYSILDTSYMLINTGIFEHNRSYLWTVTTSDYQYSTSCLNPRSFKIIDPTNFTDFTDIIPDQYILQQNYPNPFNPETTIEFSIPKTEFVTLTIYNILGQEITTLISKILSPGNYHYIWNASAFASGIYYYKLKIGKNFNQTRKMLYLK
jgi:hypothetical protein